MIITCITTKPPCLESGSEVRNYYLFKALLDSPKISSVKLIYINYNASKKDILLLHKKLTTVVFSLPPRSLKKSLGAYVRGEAPYVEHLIKNPFVDKLCEELKDESVVLVSELDGYLVSSLALASLGKEFIFDCHNVDYLRFKSDIELSPLPKRLLGKLLVSSITRHETAAVKQATKVLCCSVNDKKVFSQFVKKNKIFVVPNGVEVRPLSTQKNRSKQSVLFMGLLSYQPNADGIKNYLEEIHPLVQKSVPNVEMLILGKNPPNWLKDRAQIDSSIKVLGFVKDTKKYFDEARVCICPLRYGSGTRLKVLEYMAAGKSVVSTSVGAEGIEVKKAEHIFLEDKPDDFATTVTSLLLDEKKATRFGLGARKWVHANYNWQNIGKNLIKILEHKA